MITAILDFWFIHCTKLVPGIQGGPKSKPQPKNIKISY